MSMNAVEVVYIGGPRHGEVDAIPHEALSAPKELRFPLFPTGEAVYLRREKADTPGRIAYCFVPDPQEGRNE